MLRNNAENIFKIKDDCELDVPDLGNFTDESIKDSVHSSWKQLFNELIDEGEERIDRMVSSKRGIESPDNLIKEVTPTISSYLSGVKESLSKNIESVAKYLISFVKKNYALKDELPKEIKNKVEDSLPEELNKLFEKGKTFINNSVVCKKDCNISIESPIQGTTIFNLNNKNYENGKIQLNITFDYDKDEDYGWWIIEIYLILDNGKSIRIGQRNTDNIKVAENNLKELLNKAKTNIK